MSIFLTIVFIIVFASAVAIIMIDPKPKKEPAQKKDGSSYKYKYQQFPLGDWIILTVRAENQATANQHAVEIFTGMFSRQETIMTVFYPVK